MLVELVVLILLSLNTVNKAVDLLYNSKDLRHKAHCKVEASKDRQ